MVYFENPVRLPDIETQRISNQINYKSCYQHTLFRQAQVPFRNTAHNAGNKSGQNNHS